MYLPIERGFSQHPKTKAFKRLMVDRLADAYLVRLWEWAMIYAGDGDLSRFSDDELADAVDYPEGGARLVKALLDSGYLDTPRRLHGWSEMGRGGALTYTRAMASARQRKHRNQKELPGMSRSVTPRVTQCHAEDKRSEDKRSEDKRSEEDLNPIARLASSALDGFDRFWAAYPRKVSKGHARKAWAALKVGPGLADRIIAAVEAQKTWPRGNGLNKTHDANGGGGNPHPATWLRGERWEDKPPADRYASMEGGE
jgi:hypothetical protein